MQQRKERYPFGRALRQGVMLGATLWGAGRAIEAKQSQIAEIFSNRASHSQMFTGDLGFGSRGGRAHTIDVTHHGRQIAAIPASSFGQPQGGFDQACVSRTASHKERQAKKTRAVDALNTRVQLAAITSRTEVPRNEPQLPFGTFEEVSPVAYAALLPFGTFNKRRARLILSLSVLLASCASPAISMPAIATETRPTPAITAPAAEMTGAPLVNEVLTSTPAPRIENPVDSGAYPTSISSVESPKVYSYGGPEGRANMDDGTRAMFDRYIAELAREGKIQGSTPEALYLDFDKKYDIKLYTTDTMLTRLIQSKSSGTFLVPENAEGQVFRDGQLSYDYLFQNGTVVDVGTDNFNFREFHADRVGGVGAWPVFVQVDAQSIPVSWVNMDRDGIEVPIQVAATAATSTPEAPPETAQQKRERVASELIRAGASANDPESWKKTAEGTAQYEIFENAGTPAIATDKKLAELDAFMIDLRRADMEQWIATDPGAAKAALAAFARSGLMMERSPQEADILAATAEGLTEFNASLTPKDRLLLEVVRRAMAKEEIVLSPVEIIAMETDPDGNVPYAVNVKRGRLIDGAPGYYGMWTSHSEQYMQPGAWNAMDIPYTIPMFGRTSFNGKELVRKGVLLGDQTVSDLVGIARLPEGKTGAVILLKDFDGTPYLHTYEVVLDTDTPVTIRSGSLVLGSKGPESADLPYPIIRDVSLTTRYAVDKNNYNEFIQPLSREILLNRFQWPPYWATIYSGGVQMMPAGNPSQFFDPDNGLMIIGSEVDGLRTGYLYFGTNGFNPWP